MPPIHPMLLWPLAWQLVAANTVAAMLGYSKSKPATVHQLPKREKP